MCNSQGSSIKWTLNNIPKSDDRQLPNMSLKEMKKASDFHKSFPQYSVTPLTRLSSLAEYLRHRKAYSPGAWQGREPGAIQRSHL